MSDRDTFDLRHKDDFGQVYDLDDPRPYYQGLYPADYRMPAVVAAWLREKRSFVARARGRSTPLRVLDFACGYGAVGALLRHDLSMRDVYRHYAGAWRRVEGRVNWEPDRIAFSRLRRGEAGYEIGGIDIAPVALEYARHVGFIDVGFAEDLSCGPPGPELRRFLAGVDIVTECGALGHLLTGAVQRLLHATRGISRPWFLYCPRSDIDWSGLESLWRESGYDASACVRAPVRYRKPLSDYERDQMLELSTRFGRRPEKAMASGYLLVEMTLARPRREGDGRDLEELILSDDVC